MKALRIIFVLTVREVLHMYLAAVGYLLLARFALVSRLGFSLLIVLPLAILIEYLQHRRCVADEARQHEVRRDSIIISLLLLGMLFVRFASGFVQLAWLGVFAVLALMVQVLFDRADRKSVV